MSRAIGADVRLKLETLQPTFSYKVRGAFNAVLRLAESGASRSTTTLVTASAGNHGRALAVAAATVNIPLTVYAAESAPRRPTRREEQMLEDDVRIPGSKKKYYN